MYANSCIHIYLLIFLNSYCPQLHLFYVNHSSLLSCLSVNSYSNDKKPDSHHLQFIYLIVQYHYRCIAISELLANTPWESALSIKAQYLCAVSFVFSLRLHSHTFQSNLEQYLFPISSVRSFHTFVIQLDSLVTV